MDVAVNGYLCKDIILSTDNGNIERSDDICSYFISPGKVGGANIIITSKTTKKKIGSAFFRVKNIPPPVARVAGKSGGEIGKSLLKAQIAILAVLSDFPMDSRFAIESYTIIILRAGKIVSAKHYNESRFSRDVKNAFNELEPNDKVIFSDISCKSASGAVTELQPIEFKINE